MGFSIIFLKSITKRFFIPTASSNQVGLLYVDPDGVIILDFSRSFISLLTNSATPIGCGYVLEYTGLLSSVRIVCVVFMARFELRRRRL